MLFDGARGGRALAGADEAGDLGMLPEVASDPAGRRAWRA